MSTPNEDALRCAAALRQLDGAKKYHPTGPGGQMCGSESYRLIASGFSFYELQNSADHLARLVAENESLKAGRHELQAQGKHPAPCAKFCESKAYEIEALELKRQIAEQAALIRKQGRELGEQDALLRQALEAMEATGPTWVVKERAAKAAIRLHREKKGEAG